MRIPFTKIHIVGKRKALQILRNDTELVADVINSANVAASETVGKGTSLSVLMAPMMYISRNVSAVPVKMLDSDERDVSENYRFVLRMLPQKLMYALSFDYVLYGNAYLEIVRDNIGTPTDLVYHTPYRVTPKGRNRLEGYQADTLAYYEIQTPQGITREVSPDNMVHVCMGIDPNAPLTGMSPIQALIQEASSDVEAGRAVSAVLRNHGMIGLYISPKSSEDTVDESGMKALQDKLDKSYTSTGRGKAFASSLPIDVKQTVAELDKLAFQTIRGISEERVCAVLSLPAAVIGFGVGLRQTKVGATLRELRGIAYENAILPTLEAVLRAVTEKVVFSFTEDVHLGYSLPADHVAQVNATAVADRATKLFTANIFTRAQSLEMIGYPSRPEDEIYNYELPKSTTENINVERGGDDEETN